MNIKAYVWDDEYHGESHVVWAAPREKLKRCLLPNTIENLQKCGFLAFRGLINMEIVKEYQQKNF